MKFYDIQTGQRAHNDTLIWTDFTDDEFCIADNAEEAIQITKEILEILEPNNADMDIRVREVTRDEYGGIIYGGWVYND